MKICCVCSKAAWTTSFTGWDSGPPVRNRVSWFLTRRSLVNGRAVNIASYQVQAEDVVEVSEHAREQLRIKSALQLASQRAPVEWVDVDHDKLEGVFRRLPDRMELPAEINENLIVELYSK